MPRIFVLFKLQEGADRDAYERWAVERDAPVVRALPSIESFDVHRVTGALGGQAPYDYIEVVDVSDMDAFQKDIEGAEMQAVAKEFADSYADGPVFAISEPLEPHA